MDHNERKRRKVTCKICNSIISRNNAYMHEKSKKHLTMKHVQEKMKEILKNKSN